LTTDYTDTTDGFQAKTTCIGMVYPDRIRDIRGQGSVGFAALAPFAVEFNLAPALSPTFLLCACGPG
jgi:hypothetical protein